MRRVAGVCIAVGLLVGCAAPTLEECQSPQALTVNVLNETLSSDGIPKGLPESFVLDIPKRFFDEDLPDDLYHKGVGIINNDLQFVKLWDYYARDNTALRPAIDFRTRVLLFAYDEEYYNLVRILGMEIYQGVANPILWHTNWTLSIGGEGKKERGARGASGGGKGLVNVAFLQIPRHLLPQQSGVTAVFANGELIPVPEEP